MNTILSMTSLCISLGALITLFYFYRKNTLVDSGKLAKQKDDYNTGNQPDQNDTDTFFSDLITKLPNRAKLFKDLTDGIQRNLSIINIDGFSNLNDYYSPEFGDIILSEFAKYLNEKKATKSTLYHMGGDEFVLTHPVNGYQKFKDSLYRIINDISSNMFVINNEKISLSITASMATGTTKAVYTKASIAFKRAKSVNISLQEYSDDLKTFSNMKVNLKHSNSLKYGIKNDGIIPYFQPIMDLNSNSVYKYEALARLMDENGDNISPYYFIDIAKRLKLYSDVTMKVVEKAFKKASSTGANISINLDAEDFKNPDVMEFIYVGLDFYELYGKITFEITESEDIQYIKDVLNFRNKIKTYGCYLSVDDFGSGYSNFNYLMELKPDFIKIDGSIIKKVLTSEESEILIETVVRFCEKSNIKSIAEFVNSKEILNRIKDLGVDYAQGYYIGKPAEKIIQNNLKVI